MHVVFWFLVSPGLFNFGWIRITRLLIVEQTCAAAVSPEALSAIAACILAHRRLHGTGLPDLLLWRKRHEEPLGTAVPHEFRFVEVKGPGEALHPNQVEWIEFMETVFPSHVAVALVSYDA